MKTMRIEQVPRSCLLLKAPVLESPNRSLNRLCLSNRFLRFHVEKKTSLNLAFSATLKLCDQRELVMVNLDEFMDAREGSGLDVLPRDTRLLAPSPFAEATNSEILF